MIRELKALPGYVSRFDTVFGKNSLTIDDIAKAIATFERSVVSKNAPYDKYWTGDKDAMSAPYRHNGVKTTLEEVIEIGRAHV